MRLVYLTSANGGTLSYWLSFVSHGLSSSLEQRMNVADFSDNAQGTVLPCKLLLITFVAANSFEMLQGHEAKA